jgi:hypothetical protein
VDTIFAFIEHSGLSEWIRGSDSMLAFPAIITLHALGLGFLAGGGTAIDLRLLGFAPQISLSALARFLPILWTAFTVNAVSGTLLLIAYPTKAFTNPLFYVKLGLIALAVFLLSRIGTVLRGGEAGGKPPAGGTKPLALLSLVTWLSLILAGRFLAYTHRWELLGVPAIL